MEANIYWASSVFIGIVCVMSPFSMMFLVNNPFRRASKVLAKNGCALLGYTSAEEFGGVNAVVTDASALFPKSARATDGRGEPLPSTSRLSWRQALQ